MQLKHLSIRILLIGLIGLGPVAQVQAEDDNAEWISALASTICAHYSTSGVNIASDTKKSIKRYMAKHEGIKNATGPQMLKFLNKNRHKMTCKDKYDVEKNYMKYAFDRSSQGDLFDLLFVDQLIPEDLSVLINVNAVSFTGPGGTPETVLDYVNNLIKTNKFGTAMTEEIIALKELLVEDLNAKSFKALPAAEQAMFKR